MRNVEEHAPTQGGHCTNEDLRTALVFVVAIRPVSRAAGRSILKLPHSIFEQSAVEICCAPAAVQLTKASDVWQTRCL